MCATALIVLLPDRYQVAPSGLPLAGCGLVILTMLGVGIAPKSVPARRLERAVILVMFVLGFALQVLTIARLIKDMIAPAHRYNGVTLLESGVVIWVVTILIFSLFYWQLDGAGPERRAADGNGTPDFSFAEYETSAETPAWQPRFADYLFIAFATSTSFTPPDYCRPASRRAKVLAMVQASTSLSTLVIIASRAVATLS
jgi:hypothetical protein